MKTQTDLSKYSEDVEARKLTSKIAEEIEEKEVESK